MTNTRAVIAEVGFPGVPEDMVEKALIDVNLDANGLYSKDNTIPVLTSAINVLVGMKSVESMSEGSFSIKFNSKEADKTIVFLAKKIKNAGGEIDLSSIIETPTVTGVSVW